MKRRDALINRHNYTDTRAYLLYCEEVRLNKENTLISVRVSMDHLLRWATATPLSRAPELRPVLPAYLQECDISVVYREKLLLYAQKFFQYARNRWPERYERIRFDWIDGLKVHAEEPEVQERVLYDLEHVRALTTLTPRTLTEERTIAAAAFLFLSGMRVSAFASLPLCAIEWEHKPAPLVRQWPKLGVRTKNSKAASTVLLIHEELADLRAVARAWYDKVLAAVGSEGLYYALLTPERTFDPVQ